MPHNERGAPGAADCGRGVLSPREQMLRYLLKHPEFDEPPTNGELVFWIGYHAGTGKSVVTATFHPNPGIFR